MEWERLGGDSHIPVPVLGLGKVRISPGNSSLPTCVCVWSGEKPLRIFSKPLSQAGVYLLGFIFCSALSAPSLGRAQMCPDVPRLVEQILQQHLCAGLEPQAGSE